MAVTTSLEHLPIDAVECIAKYLTSSELSNCCAVSHVWRMVFDNDIFWKNRFNKNISDYLKVAKCQVDPPFRLVESDTLQSFFSNREDCLRESRLWQNWRSGRFKREEIKFDCDDCIFIDIRVEFLNNDHVLLHRNFQTEVWNVSQEPYLVLDIPFNFFGLWEGNLYKFVSNRLVVVQCNVVQIYSIFMETKTSNLDQMFFFDKSEEFSLSKLSDINNIEEVFQESSFDITDDIKCVICGNFLLGVVSTEMENLVIHVWDISNGKKLKEEICPALPSVPSNVILKAGEKSQDKVIVIFDNYSCRLSYVFLFDLKKLEFIEQSKVNFCSCDFTLYDEYLFALSNSDLKIIDYDLTRKSLSKNYEPVVLKTFPLPKPGRLRIFQNNVLVSSNRKEIIFIDPEHQSNGDIKSIVKVDFNLISFEAVQDRFLALHDIECNLREIWEVGESSKKIVSFSEDSGIYRAVNSACTRLVLQRRNKLTILSFW